MEMNDVPMEGFATCNLSGGNFTCTSTALTAFPPVSSVSDTLNVLPKKNVPLDGENCSDAPSAARAGKPVKNWEAAKNVGRRIESNFFEENLIAIFNLQFPIFNQ